MNDLENKTSTPTDLPAEQASPPKTPNNSTLPKKKPARKPLTREQRKRRFHIMQAGLFFSMGVIFTLLVFLLIHLISLPFRDKDSKQPDSAAAPSSAAMSVMESGPSPVPVATPEPAKTVTMLAVGDNLIHSTLIEYGQQPDGSYDFTDIYSYLQEDIQRADIACIQQETIFITDPAEYTNYPAFGTPAEMADSLAEVGFDVVCHASNHALDKGQDGIDDTVAAWNKHPEVTMLGIHESQEDADEIAVVEKNGIKIALLDYTYGLNGYVANNDYTVDQIDEEHKDRIISQVTKAKALSDIVVVFMHMGNEDQFTASDEQKQWAQLFADNGVGLIIGSHPHVVEPTDVLTGSGGNKMPIFYSLGNFVSSQKDNFNMLGGLARVTITKDETGTYVSDFSMEPVVTLIQSGGSVGMGYKFHTMYLSDYTEELAATHIRSNCTPDAFKALWEEITAPAPAGENGDPAASDIQQAA